MAEVTTILSTARNPDNMDLQIIFEDDTHYFLQSVIDSLFDKSSDLLNLSPDNLKFIQTMILDKLLSDATFAEHYLLSCVQFLIALRQPVDPKYQDFLIQQLSNPDRRIGESVLMLFENGLISIDESVFVVAVQNEIKKIIDGGDDVGLQYALNAIIGRKLKNCTLILRGARKQFSDELLAIEQQTDIDPWRKVYLSNAIRGIDRALGFFSIA